MLLLKEPYSCKTRYAIIKTYPIFVYECIYIYIYIERERERERENKIFVLAKVSTR